jgi:serine/threonine protein kinase
MDNYSEERVISVGVFGVVKEVKDKRTGVHKSLKVIAKSSFELEMLQTKIENLKFLQGVDCVHISKPELILEDEKNYLIITKIIKGIELQKYVIKAKRVAEDKALSISRRILIVLKEYRGLGLLFRYAD